MIILQEINTRADMASGYGSFIGGSGGAMLGRYLFLNNPLVQNTLGQYGMLGQIATMGIGNLIGNNLGRFIARKLVTNPNKKIDPKNSFQRFGVTINNMMKPINTDVYKKGQYKNWNELNNTTNNNEYGKNNIYAGLAPIRYI